MTVSTTASRVSFAGNGATTTFAFAFKIWSAADLKVYLRDNTTLVDTLQTLTTDYTVDIVTYPNTGNVVFVTAPAAGKTVVILRDLPMTQDLDLVGSGTFAAENIEIQLDKLVGELQTLREKIARTPQMPVGTALADLVLPEPKASVATNLIGINATGDGLALYTKTTLSVGQAVSAFIVTLLDDADAATARATLGIGATDLNALTTDATGGALADFIPFVDASEANASNKVLITDLLYNALNNLTADATPDMTVDHLLARDNSASGVKKVLMGLIGAGKQTMWIPAAAITPRTTNGPAAGSIELATNKVMVKTLDFDATTAEFAQFTVQMPKNWNLGTVTFLAVWSHAATATNFGVAWTLAGLALSDNEAQDAAFGTAISVTDTGGTTNNLYRTVESSAVTIGSTPVASDVVIFQIGRNPADAADTMAIDARLHGVAVFYTTNANTDV